jgi:hypothetical protein
MFYSILKDSFCSVKLDDSYNQLSETEEIKYQEFLLKMKEGYLMKYQYDKKTETIIYTTQEVSTEEHKKIILLTAQENLTATDTYVVKDTFAYMPLAKKTSITNYRSYLQNILYNDDFDFSKIKELKTLQDF